MVTCEVLGKCWKVMLGRGSTAAGEARAEGFIGADYGADEDLSNQLSEDWREFNDLWIPKFLEMGRQDRISAGLASGELWTVAKGIQIGDLVLSPTASNWGELYVGIVTSDYHFRQGEILPHRRGVDWQPNTLKKSDCSDELRAGLGYGSTVCSLDRYGDEIIRLIGASASRWSATSTVGICARRAASPLWVAPRPGVGSVADTSIETSLDAVLRLGEGSQ